MPNRQVIHIHADAPRKPTYGAVCNGCGVCCVVEACPLGAILSLRKKGPCRFLLWSDAAQRYHCGLLAGTTREAVRPWSHRWIARWIAAGTGCDCTLDASVPRNPATPAE